MLDGLVRGQVPCQVSFVCCEYLATCFEEPYLLSTHAGILGYLLILICKVLLRDGRDDFSFKQDLF